MPKAVAKNCFGKRLNEIISQLMKVNQGKFWETAGLLDGRDLNFSLELEFMAAEAKLIEGKHFFKEVLRKKILKIKISSLNTFRKYSFIPNKYLKIELREFMLRSHATFIRIHFGILISR